MNSTMFKWVVGAATCIAVVATAWDAEAGWRRRSRNCCEPCETSCCTPAYTSCAPMCETSCAPACGTVCETVASYDRCGRIVYRQACYATVASSSIVLPAASCCGGIACTSTPAKAEALVKAAPAQETVKTPTVAATR